MNTHRVPFPHTFQALLRTAWLLLLGLAPAAAAVPPVPSQPTATCAATANGKCYVNGSFTLTSSSPGASHYHVCRSEDTSGWGGCATVIATYVGGSYTVSGADLPSDGFRRAYYFKACDAANACTSWADTDEAYVHLDATGPAAPGPTTTTCQYQSGGNCWVTGAFSVGVTPAATDSGSGVDPNNYKVCRSNDSSGGFVGCAVGMADPAGTSFTVTGSNMPSDGQRRSYWFKARDLVGNSSEYNTPRYVRVDRYDPRPTADNASEAWFASRTVTVTGADDTGGALANSGLAELRYRWNAAHNGTCTSGHAIASGSAIPVPVGDNRLYLCARDNTGRIGYWNGGPYRVDTAPTDRAQLVSATLPAALACGATFNAAVTLQNLGSTTWTAAGGYRLGAVADTDPFAVNGVPGEVRVPLPPGVTLAPGQSHTFAFTLRAPAQAGTYRTDWRMVHDGVGWFGPTAASDAAVTCTGASFSLAIDPATRTVPRLSTRTVTVTVSGAGGFTAPVALSAGGLPAGVSASFAPASVAPGGSSTLTLRATIDAALGTSTLTVTGTGGGMSRTAQAELTVNQHQPVVDSVAPELIRRGQTTQLALRGDDLMAATVYVATAPYGEGSPPPRTYPTAQWVSVNASAKLLVVAIDASAPGIDGFYNLVVETPGGTAAAQFRVTGPEPVVDLWTPSEPIQGRVHVFTAVGANLLGAEIVPLSAGVRVLDLDNSEDSSLSGLLYVAAGTGATQISIHGTGGTINLPLEPHSDIGTTTKATSLVDVEGARAGESPEIVVQEPAMLLDIAPPPASTKQLPGWCILFTATHTVSYSRILLSLFDENDNPLSQEILDALFPGSTLRVNTTTLAVTGFLQIFFSYQVCDGWTTDLFFCGRGGTTVMVPGVGGQSLSFNFCLGQGGVWTDLAADGFLGSFNWSSSNACVTARDLGGLVNGQIDEGALVGTRAAEIEMTCCAPAVLSATIQGQALGASFDVGGSVAEIQPSCAAWRRYDIEMRAFLPFNNVGPADFCPIPNSAILLYFEGDDRGFSADPGLNFRELPAYRMQQVISVYADERACALGLCDPNGLVLDSWLNSVGESASYAQDALFNEPLGKLTMADMDGVSLDCHLWHQSGTAAADGWSAEVLRIGPRGVQVRLTAAAAVPITQLPAPAIDWDVIITVEDTPAGPRFTVGGASDCFPAYEAYVNNKQVLGFLPPNSDPLRIGFCLVPPADVTYQCSGYLEDPTPPSCLQSF